MATGPHTLMRGQTGAIGLTCQQARRYIAPVHATDGRLAQLVEHSVHIAGVTGSNPVPPTISSHTSELTGKLALYCAASPMISVSSASILAAAAVDAASSRMSGLR